MRGFRSVLCKYAVLGTPRITSVTHLIGLVMIEGVVAEVVAGAERVSRGSQAFLHIQRDRVVATEHAPSDPFRVFERRHGLADIGARGGAVVEELEPPADGGGNAPPANEERVHVSSHAIMIPFNTDPESPPASPAPAAAAPAPAAQTTNVERTVYTSGWTAEDRSSSEPHGDYGSWAR